MPLQRRPILIPVEGLDYSKPSTFINDRAGFPKNMRYYRAEMRKNPGKIKYGATALTGQVMGYGVLELSTGSKYLVRASKTEIQRYNTATEDWVSISSSAPSGGDDDFFFFANIPESGIIIITNGVNAIRKWTGSGNNSALGGSPPKAKYCAYLSPYLLLAYTDDGVTKSPWTVQWCDTGDPETWSGGNAGSQVLSDEPSAIQNIMKLNEYAAVYKKNSIWLGRKVDTSDVFLLDCVKTGVGLFSSRALVDVEGVHYFLGSDDVYAFSGSQLSSTGEKVRDEIFSKIDRSKNNRCFAISIKELNEVWFFITVVGKGWPTEVWKYNYRTGFWYYDTCDDLTAAIMWEKTSSETWDDQTLTWDEAILRWDDNVNIESWEEIIFGRDDGYSLKLDYTITNDDGTVVDAEYQSIDFIADELEFEKRWEQLDLWLKGPGNIYVDYSTDYGATWTNIPYSTTQAYIAATDVYTKYEMYFDVIAEHMRFRLRNSGSNETFYIRNLYPYYLKKSQTRS